MENMYYTAEQAMKALSKPRSTFFKDVENGLIPSELEPGRQRGRKYPKQAIDALAKRMNKQKGKDYTPTHLVLAPSTISDLWNEVQIGLDLYGEDDIVPFDVMLDWQDINDEMFMHLKDHNQSVGYSSLMPIDEEILKTLIYDKIREKDVPLRAVRQWTEPRLSVYIATLTVKPSGNKKLDRERGSFLIKQTIKWALSLNRQFDVKNWYGIGATPEGQELFERLGFREIASLHNGERKGYLAEDIKQPVKLVNDMLSQVKRNDTSLTAKMTAKEANNSERPGTGTDKTQASETPHR